MTLDLDPDVLRLIDTISVQLGHSLNSASTKPVKRPVGKIQISDASLAFYVDGQQPGASVVLLLSNPIFPGVVSEDIDKARAIERLVAPNVEQHIVKPLITGVYNGQSYAVFKRLQPLSDNKVLRYAQKRAVSPSIAQWLADLCMQTKTPRTTPSDILTFFHTPLRAIINEQGISPQMRAFGATCLSALPTEGGPFFTCVEHGDFWLGNILFEPESRFLRAHQLGPFQVIDWRGARMDGYPCLDLARYCLSSFRQGAKDPARLFKSYQKSLGLTPFETGLYCMVSLGRLGLNLDKFPKERYCAMAERVFDLLKSLDVTKTAAGAQPGAAGGGS